MLVRRKTTGHAVVEASRKSRSLLRYTVCVQRARRVISDAFHRTYPAKVAALPRKAATYSCRGLVSISRRAPATLAASERGEQGWAKLYLTRRVKGRSLARARVPDYGAHERGSRSYAVACRSSVSRKCASRRVVCRGSLCGSSRFLETAKVVVPIHDS